MSVSFFNIKKRLDLLVITQEPFPYGMAATNRIISYLKIISDTLKSKVLIFRPTEKKEKIINKIPKGYLDNISYEYTCNLTYWPFKSVLLKIIFFFYGLFMLTLSIIKTKPKAIIVYSNIYYVTILLLALRTFLNYRLIIEETEYPKCILNKKGYLSKIINIKLYKKADGMIVMTKTLEKYYRTIGVKYIFVLPMTVDANRFNNLEVSINRGNYFVYLGSGGAERDGLIEIIKAFQLFRLNKSGYKLLLAGNLDKNSNIIRSAINFIKLNKLEEDILFTGYIKYEEIPKLLGSSIANIMLPQKIFITGGFPTKLGEYLMSGRPVIITNVGELSAFLNESNAFIVPPGDLLYVSNVMNYIIEHKKEADEIGMRGREFALKYFNPLYYKKDLIKFIMK